MVPSPHVENYDRCMLILLLISSFNTVHTVLAAITTVCVREGGLAHWAAFTFRNGDLLTTDHLITLHVIAQDGATVAHADPTWLRFPHISVGVDLPILDAAEFITYRK